MKSTNINLAKLNAIIRRDGMKPPQQLIMSERMAKLLGVDMSSPNVRRVTLRELDIYDPGECANCGDQMRLINDCDHCNRCDG